MLRSQLASASWRAARSAAFGLLLALAAPGVSLRAVSPAELAARLESSETLLLVDVRPSLAYQEAHIPGAISIPLALLPQKTLPAGAHVVVYADGLGLIGDEEALAVARELRVASVDVLEGGFAAWQSTAALTTAAGGAARERLPGITYQQLVAAPKDGVVLVDLRPPTVVKAGGAATTQSAPAPDVVATFAQKLGVPVRRGPGTSGARTMSAASSSSAPADAARTAAAIATDVAAAEKNSTGAPPLLVLVADSDAAASEAARQLRGSGYHRFTILIGGTLTIEHEGRAGSARAATEPEVVHGQN